MLGTEFVLDTIAKAGVGHLFMFIGGLVDSFLPAIAAGPLTPIIAANESGAAYAADGYARATRHFGAVLMIGGPGVFNAVGAIGAADADRVPLLVLTGETATAQQGRGSFQDATVGGEDDTRLLDAMTRGSHLVPSAAALPQYMRNAYHAMLATPRRPVHVALPKDVQDGDVGEPLWIPRKTLEPPRLVDGDALENLGREGLIEATRIAILAGDGAHASDASDDLRAVAEQLQIPVASTFRAKGVLPEDHPLSLGMFGYAGNPPAEDCILAEDVEVVLAVGTSLNQRDTLDWNARLSPRLGLAHLNLADEELGRWFPARWRIAGDARTFLRALLDEDRPWAQALRATAAARRSWADAFLSRPRFLDADNMTSDAVPLHTARVIADLRKALPRDAALLIDSGAHRAFAGHYFPVLAPNRLFSATGLGPMGWAIAASVGVATALEATPVAVVTGDGCMLQNGVEIQTAARHGLRILYVVINNSALGNVYLRARTISPEVAAFCELPTHDWTAFAQSLGVRAARIDHPDDLAPAFADFVERGGPMLVDVRCARDVATPVAPWVEATRHPDIYAE